MESIGSTRPGIRLRQALYFGYHRAKGESLGAAYRRFRAEDRARLAAPGLHERLRAILHHARTSVPYYRQYLGDMRAGIERDPVAVLRGLPVMTKQTIRARSDELQSVDVGERKTREETSGGSTGEPVRLIQDSHYTDCVAAVQILYSTWAGRELGEPEVMIWGAEDEVLAGSLPRRTRIANKRWEGATSTPSACHRGRCEAALRISTAIRRS